MRTPTIFTCALFPTSRGPIRCCRIIAAPSSSISRRSNWIRTLPSPMLVWPRPAPRSFISTNRSIPGKQERAARRRLALVCNRIWAKRISPSANALIGLTTITNGLCASLRIAKVFCLTIATSARSSPLFAGGRESGRNRSRSTNERGSSTRKIRTLRATSFIPIRRCANGRRRGTRSSVGARWRPIR